MGTSALALETSLSHFSETSNRATGLNFADLDNAQAWKRAQSLFDPDRETLIKKILPQLWLLMQGERQA